MTMFSCELHIQHRLDTSISNEVQLVNVSRFSFMQYVLYCIRRLTIICSALNNVHLYTLKNTHVDFAPYPGKL